MDFKKFYDEQKEYSAFRCNNEKRIEYEIKVSWKAEQLKKLIPDYLTFNSVLEIGCAMGILLNNLAEQLSIKNVYGLDISGENIKVAKELYPGNTFFQGTIEDLKSITSKNCMPPEFDLIILSDIIEHIPDEMKFLKMVKEISSYVLINLPLEKCFRNRHRKYGEDDHSGHLHCYDREMALSLINQTGFEVINSFTSNVLKNKACFKIYQNDRKERLKLKPFPRKIFWTFFYFAEDRILQINNKLYEKIYGTNYFILLKSKT
jgi:SAM-dependent methyltransferase